MSFFMEELDYRQTPMGLLSLRRRREPVTGKVVYEIKLNDEFLMSSLFTEAEEELARLGLGWLDQPEGLDVVVGGLGLGYTALTALRHPGVARLWVMDALPEVIGWHQSGLLPLGPELCADPRCHLVHADFFALARGEGFVPGDPQARVHAILLDVDHSPRHPLHPSHLDAYSLAGLQRFADRLHPGGVFALWSNDPPEAAFLEDLKQIFATADAQLLTFPNPITGGHSANSVYLAQTAPA